MKKIILALGAILALSIIISFIYPKYQQDSEYLQVVKVIDGDTIKVNSNGSEITVRLIGIDTPEVKTKSTQEEKGGSEASSFAKNLLTNSKVRLASDPGLDNKDKYGRLLRYVYLQNGKMLNEIMLEEGYATEFTYHKEYRYSVAFRLEESQAKANKKGLWK